MILFKSVDLIVSGTCIFQLLMFSNRLNGGSIGISVLKVFVIDKTFAFTVRKYTLRTRVDNYFFLWTLSSFIRCFCDLGSIILH